VTGDRAVDEAAEALYAVLPRDFVAARDARVKELRAAGDAEAARAVAALRRPTVVAWLANQLVRRHADQVGPLLDLGAALREATATLSGPQLRELSRQRHQVVAALVGQARRLAAAEGQPVTEDAARGLEQTLTAALADEGAADLLRAGRLTDALVPGGFGAAPTSAGRRPVRAARTKPAAPQDPAAAERAARRAALETDLAAAWAAARAAADARSAAEDSAGAAEAAARDTARTAQRLRAELAAAEEAAATAEQERSAAVATRDGAREEAEQATRRVTELQRALDDA